MNFKRFHESKNLLDMSVLADGYHLDTTTGLPTQRGSNDRVATLTPIDVSDISVVTLSYLCTVNNNNFMYSIFDANDTLLARITSKSSGDSIDVSSAAKLYIAFYSNSAVTISSLSQVMLNTGSTPLPYEPYSSEVWHDTSHYIHNTSTDTLTTLPAVLYPNDTTATVGLKGNTVQNGTPTPDSPIMPDGCGDLETVGAKAGQYKIPILSNSTTTPVYLGEVQSTRRIKKLVLTGEENWRYSTSSQVHWIENVPNDYDNTLISRITTVCTHYKCIQNNTGFTGMVNGDLRLYAKETSPIAHELYIKDETYTSAADFKTYLAQQYAAGTPVTVWYVLATPETGIVNEPLRKIGDYADEVSGISIPTIAGANTIDVDTTLKPSEVSINYHGWHPVSAVHERENGAWD